VNIKISKYYNKKKSEIYESSRNNQIWLNENDIFLQIKNKLAIKFNRKIKVLDVPVGTGRWIPYIDDFASEYVGVDISQNMLDQAAIKLKNCPQVFQKNAKLIKSSVMQLPIDTNGYYDWVISTRFLPHFSTLEVKEIMKKLKYFAKADLLIMVRVTDKQSNIKFEILNLILKSPFRAVKRYLKSGRLTYTKLDSEYNRILKEMNFKIIKKNLVLKEKYSRFEYWEIKSN